MKTVRLKVPLQEKEVRALNIGDIVYLDGLCYTGRTLFHRRVVEQNILPPIDFEKVNVFVHVGPVMAQAGKEWRPLSVDPTSSIRFEKYGPQIITRLKIRAIVGKTTMGAETLKAMRDYGCVHLSKVGICGDILASKVKRVVAVYNREELGNTEATWLLETENFGPFLVDMDTKGRNYYESINQDVHQKLQELYSKLGIPADYTYTEV